jgi:exodeoxyribonuclease V alpha subunit
VTVDILGRGRVTFTADKSHLLTLAYASTVHKCQGSEFPLVVVVLTRGHYVMLQRNLLYTAITRAKRHLVVVHQPGALERAVQNDRIAERHSRLAERLRTGA